MSRPLAFALLVGGLAIGASTAPISRAQEAIAAATQAVGAPSAPRASMSGTFRFSGGAPERARVERAIDRAIDGIFFVIRPMAADKIRGENPVYPELTINVEADAVSVQYLDRLVRTTDGGPRVRVISHTNEPLLATHEWTRNGFAHVFELQTAGGGIKRNDFAFSSDASTFELRVLMESPQLPHPVRYRLPYARVAEHD